MTHRPRPRIAGRCRPAWMALYRKGRRTLCALVRAPSMPAGLSGSPADAAASRSPTARGSCRRRSLPARPGPQARRLPGPSGGHHEPGRTQAGVRQQADRPPRPDRRARRTPAPETRLIASRTTSAGRRATPHRPGPGASAIASISGRADRDRRVGQIAAQPAGVLPAGLRARAEQDPLVKQPSPARTGSPQTTASSADPAQTPLSPVAEPHRLDGRDQGQRQRVGRQAPRPERHRRARLEDPEHVVEPQRVAQVEDQAEQVGRQEQAGATGYATRAAAPKTPGAARSPAAATRNSPVVMLLKSMSQATRRCQLGALVTRRAAYPAPSSARMVVVHRHLRISAGTRPREARRSRPVRRRSNGRNPPPCAATG